MCSSSAIGNGVLDAFVTVVGLVGLLVTDTVGAFRFAVGQHDLVAVAPATLDVPVVDCPTTFAYDAGPQPTLPRSEHVASSPPVRTAVYASADGLTTLMAPAGWSCSASVGSDGSTVLDAWPPGETEPAIAGSGDGMVASTDPACVGCAFDLTCGVFSAALTAPLNPGSVFDCQSNVPADETDTYRSQHDVEFADPPYVQGTGDFSGGADPAVGVVTLHAESLDQVGSPTAPPPAAQLTCVLPDSSRTVCAAAIADFEHRYG